MALKRCREAGRAAYRDEAALIVYSNVYVRWVTLAILRSALMESGDQATARRKKKRKPTGSGCVSQVNCCP